MANGLPHPPEPRGGGGGGGRGLTPGAWKRFKACAAKGRKRGLSRGVIKHLHIGNFPFNCIQPAPGLGPCQGRAPSFHVAPCPPVTTVSVGPQSRSIVCWHPQLGASISEAEVLSLQAWPSGGPCGICKVTQSLWALDLSPGNQKKGLKSSGSQRCRPGAGLGAGRPKLESWLLNSLAGNLGQATQTLYKRVCVCKMETAPAYSTDSRGGNELLHTGNLQLCRHTLSAQCT